MATHEPARRFQDLVVWQKSHQLALLVYRATLTFRSTSCTV
ncbi:MAG TPA: four helix bundle protein [Vicinamibacterales bacterium]|nr:four helix bundle protein [Vicinamibacterales bacterium]